MFIWHRWGGGKGAFGLLFGLLLAFFLFLGGAHADYLYPEGYVFDLSRGLVWPNHTFTAKNWTNATSFADDVDYESLTDWRLPTRTELGYLESSTHTPKILPAFDLGPAKNWSVWTSETFTDSRYVAPLSSRAYLYSFFDNLSYSDTINSHHAFLIVCDVGAFLFDSDDLYLVGHGNQVLIGESP
jgi:hypothetical protein